jgi:signal transduction histidine kinase
MSIRNKIIFWFILFTGILVTAFSFYIYFTFDSSRKKAFEERLKRKVNTTIELYQAHDTQAENIFNTISEQSEYVFDSNYKLLFSFNASKDFKFTNLPLIKPGVNYFFQLPPLKGQYPKEGVLKAFFINNTPVYFVTIAYNKTGYEQLEVLRHILFYGNIFIILIIAVVGYYFSLTTLKPLNGLLGQINQMHPGDLKMPLKYKNETDEVGLLTIAFNNLLSEIKKLMESQKNFVAYASHELRTPLAALSGIIETSLKYDKTIESFH